METSINTGMNKERERNRKMNNVILFESADSTYYVVYNLETQEFYDCDGKEIDDINDILYGPYTHIVWNRAYKNMCLEVCRCTDFEYMTIHNRRDSIIAYSLENSRSIIIEFA